MAVVISQDQNEIQTFKKWGLDIIPHREKMEKRAMDKEFKDSKNPFRVVFVCAMWLTGFDVKSLSCLYLDKPLKAHTLMQTIARANRVNEGKSNGLIIDYIGVVKALREALATYTITKGGTGGKDPTVDKSELIKRVLDTIQAATDFLFQHGFILQELIDAKDFKKIELIQKAADLMCASIEIKKTFETYAYELIKLFKYLDRDDVDEDTRRRKNAIIAIYDELQKKRKHADNTDLMVEINRIMNDYVSVEESDESEPSKQFDISKIDFDLLRKEFEKTKSKNLVIKDLGELVKEKIKRLMENNPKDIMKGRLLYAFQMTILNIKQKSLFQSKIKMAINI